MVANKQLSLKKSARTNEVRLERSFTSTTAITFLKRHVKTTTLALMFQSMLYHGVIEGSFSPNKALSFL